MERDELKDRIISIIDGQVPSNRELTEEDVDELNGLISVADIVEDGDEDEEDEDPDDAEPSGN